jgi:hypothetical protein
VQPSFGVSLPSSHSSVPQTTVSPHNLRGRIAKDQHSQEHDQEPHNPVKRLVLHALLLAGLVVACPARRHSA